MRTYCKKQWVIVLYIFLIFSMISGSAAQATSLNWDSITTVPSSGDETNTSPMPSESADTSPKVSTPVESNQGAFVPESSDNRTLYDSKVSMQFPRDLKYPVYTGPGEDYVRANNGKALVSTNGWIDVLGTDGQWMLIQYERNDGAWRRGYIPRSALPAGATVTEITKANVQVIILSTCELTDDPVMNRESLMSLSAGTVATFLHNDGDWAYIEVSVGRSKYRGYVPGSSVQ